MDTNTLSRPHASVADFQNGSPYYHDGTRIVECPLVGLTEYQLGHLVLKALQASQTHLLTIRNTYQGTAGYYSLPSHISDTDDGFYGSQRRLVTYVVRGTSRSEE